MAIRTPPAADGGSRNVDKVYGDGINQQAIQQSTPGSPTAAQAAPPQSGPTPPPPGSLGGFTDPTARPDEPLTAGLALGEGPGPGPIGQNGGGDDDLWELRALLAARPQSRDLAKIIALAEGRM